MQIQHAGDAASLKAHDGVATQPSLSQAQMEPLFTTHGIRLGKLTGGSDLDPNAPGDEGVKVSIIPFDQDNDDFKAAGSITIDAYDLADSDTHIGHWDFSTSAARALWNGKAFLYEYIVACPWQSLPKHKDVTIRATFVDALTGRSFSEQKVVAVKLP